MELNHNRGDAGDPFPGSSGKNAVTQSTTPNTKSYAGADTCVSVKNIPASSSAMTVDVTVTCGPVKQFVKETVKEHKELRKEVIKEKKEFAKETVKEQIKERKETIKETLRDKIEVKENQKEFKEAAKEVKEGGFENWPPNDWRRFGGGGGGEFAEAGGSVEARLAALEAVVFGDPTGGADQGSEAFIDSALRPDLTGSGGTRALEQGLPSGDAAAKREFDTNPG